MSRRLGKAGPAQRVYEVALGQRKKPQGNEIIVEKNLTAKISKVEAEDESKRRVSSSREE